MLISLLLIGCAEKEAVKENFNAAELPVFKRVLSSQSGVTFKNTVDENIDNYFDFFAYVYNGGGVGIGDINNDGLSDVYFTGNEAKANVLLKISIALALSVLA